MKHKNRTRQESHLLVRTVTGARDSGLSRQAAAQRRRPSAAEATREEGCKPAALAMTLAEHANNLDLVYGPPTEVCLQCQRSVTIKNGLRCTHGPGPNGEFICPGRGGQGMVEAVASEVAIEDILASRSLWP
jgi:hypothetical protein